MKVVILAGGLGTRIREETDYRPKPMIGIGGKLILWYIMKVYSTQGVDDFVIRCSYRGMLSRNTWSISYYICPMPHPIWLSSRSS
jgi:glucose-1-phosphate cytidylyltransferase